MAEFGAITVEIEALSPVVAVQEDRIERVVSPAPSSHSPVDVESITGRREALEEMLNSAYLEATARHASPSSRYLARKDYHEAIKLADAVPQDWVGHQTKLCRLELTYTQHRYENTIKEFRGCVDIMPTALRRQVNHVAFQLMTAYRNEGTSTWDTHPELLGKLNSLLTPEGRLIHDWMVELDRKHDLLHRLCNDLQELQHAPAKARFLAARYLANEGDLDGSRGLLMQICELNPAVKNSSAFSVAYENPLTLNELDWRSIGGVRRSAEPVSSYRDI